MRIVQEIQIWLLEDLMNLIMGQFIMASGIKKDRGKEKESRFGRMEPNMKATGRTTFKMGRVLNLGVTVASMKVATRRA